MATRKKKSTKKKAAKKTSKKAVKKKAKKSTKKVAKKKTAKKKTAKKAGAAKKATKKKAKKASAPLKTYKAKVSEGKSVPNFTAEMTGGEPFSLKDYRGKILVIYFYPKDSTPGCTVEGQDFTRLHKEFRKQGVEVFGVSRDSLRSHENFKAKQNYSIELISDPEEKMCAIFGTIKLKNMYGKQVRGIDRSTFIIDKNGKLVKEWRGVKVPDHAKAVLEFVKGL